jgi:hypothetical protein
MFVSFLRVFATWRDLFDIAPSFQHLKMSGNWVYLGVLRA